MLNIEDIHTYYGDSYILQGISLGEQNLRFALTQADYLHILSRGQIVYSSSPKDLDQNPEIKSRYLGV